MPQNYIERLWERLKTVGQPRSDTPLRLVLLCMSCQCACYHVVKTERCTMSCPRQVSNGFAFEFCILAKLANEGGNLAFLPNPGRLGKGRSVSPPARPRLFFAPYSGNFHRDISRHKVPIGLRLLFATQSLTTRRRPPREETPPHAPPSRSRHKVSMCRRSPRDRNTSTRVVVRCRSRRIAPPEAMSSRPPSIPPTPTFNASSRPPNVHHTSASSQIAHEEDGYVSLSSPGSYQSW
ncbi:hypothetical protein BDA96_10G006100 [Sorghum bicolor]|uniref:Uncharacterized protein n=1 Tax=Sorghum bicolor TaxID=4558 RepID=A0A921Q0L1_SORBI|nr:hypothetical protein BDA96_10G006100 [Sorghum bicolor]